MTFCKKQCEFIIDNLQRLKRKFESMLQQDVWLLGSGRSASIDAVRAQIDREAKMSDPEILDRLDEIDREIAQVEDMKNKALY